MPYEIKIIGKRLQLAGLGLEWAICINIFGAAALTAWLLSGNLQMPWRGQVFFWGVAILVLALSGPEILGHIKSER